MLICLKIIIKTTITNKNCFNNENENNKNNIKIQKKKQNKNSKNSLNGKFDIEKFVLQRF